VSSLKSHDSSWVFVAPIFGVELTEHVDNELRIERTNFISADRLRRIRDRLGIKKRFIKKIDNRDNVVSGIDDYMRKHDTFAVLRKGGKPEEIQAECYRRVQDEVAILALSQLHFKKRRFTGFIGLAGEHNRSASSHIFLDSQKTHSIISHQLLRSPQTLTLDEDWKTFQNKTFFFRLIRILNGKVNVAPGWRQDLRRAAILIGKSINSNDIATAFLWNMISLELLTTHQGDSYSTALPKRIGALLGWHPKWESEDYEDKIQRIYRRRCEYVHDGDNSKISKDALLFTDKLVFNVLWNLVEHSNHFGSKNEFIEFADKVEARETLGYQRLKHPQLKFADIQYTKKDIEEV